MAKGRPTSFCKLCCQTKLLCDSHYLPKVLYGRAMAKELKNPNPIMAIKGQLKQINDQYRGYVFCESCEDRLNELGEAWVLDNIPHSYGAPFPLQDALAGMIPTVIAKELWVCDVSRVKQFDMQQLIYFGMSIFWRAAVHEWKTSSGQKAPSVDMEPSVKESMRQFLLELAPFPKEMVLTLNIWPYKSVLPLCHPVVGDQLPQVRRYWFYVWGLHFFLFVGAHIPKDVRESDATKGIVAFDLIAANDLWHLTKSGLEAQFKGPKIKAMFEEIAAIRSKLPPKN